MKKLILILVMPLMMTSAFARVHCLEQAQQMALSVYDLNLKDGYINHLTKVTDEGDFTYEFIFVEGQCDGTRILVKMEPQKDPGTHCNMKSITRTDLHFSKVPLCN